MTTICVDNTPIMLQSLRVNATEAFLHANVQAFLAADSALNYATKHGCDVLHCEINPSLNINFVAACSESEHAKAAMHLKPSGYLTKEATSFRILEELRNLRYPLA